MRVDVIRSRLVLALTVTACVAGGCSQDRTPSENEPREVIRTMTREARDRLSPQQILQRARDGNRRFLRGEELDRDVRHDMRITAEGQHPAAVVLGCIDSRAPAELVFDLGIGDVFNARVAGNVVNADIAGSIEYACKVAGAKVVMVMGHTQCGAVKSACDGVDLGNITGLLAHIRPAIEAVQDVEGERSPRNPEFVAAVARQNVLLAKQKLIQISPILAEMAKNGEIIIVGSMYDVRTGEVTFYD